MAARERVEFDVIGRDLGGSKAFKDVGDAADKAGDKIKDSGEKAKGTGEHYRGLAHEIEQVEGNVRRLAEEIDRTGNKDLFKDLRKQQSELRKLNRVKDLLPDVDTAAFTKQGMQAGEAFSGGFRGVLASPQGIAIGAVIAGFLVPTLSAAVEGAVVGGVGVGGVVGGIALASKDARVQAAGKALGETVMADLNESGSRFVEPTLQGIGIIRSAWNDISGDVDASLAAAARYVEPLAEGVADFGRELAPGIRQAAEAAGPIIQVVREDLPELGSALSDMLSNFSDDADEGASAVRFLFQVVEGGIDTVSGLVHTLAQAYRTVLDIADAAVTVDEALLGWNPIFKGTIEDGRKRVDELKAALDKSGDSGSDAGGKIEGGLHKVDSAASTATVKVETLDEALKRLTGQNISTEEANIRLEDAIDRAAEAAKRNGDGIDKNIPKQRENRQALIDIAKATNEVYQKTLDETGSRELAAQAAERGRKKFLETAAAMHVEAGKAKALADKLFDIPEEVDSEVKVTANVQPAIDSAKGVVARINAMKARINVYAEPHGSFGGGAHTGFGYSTGMSDGGMVTGTGPKGVDTQPRMLAIGEGVLTAGEVDSLGGPAGFQQLRMALRSGRQATVGASAGQSTASSGPGVDALLAELRALRQLVASTPLVRLDSGRTADIYSRGG